MLISIVLLASVNSFLIQTDISYWPSEVSTQTSSLKFSSTILGGWNFELFGVGLPPTTMETTILVATVDMSRGDQQNLSCVENLRIVNVLDRDVAVQFRIVSDEPSTSGRLFSFFFFNGNC